MNSSSNKEKIAVIGMGVLFPGSHSIDQFWDNLIRNKDLTGNSETTDFGANPFIFYHPDKGKIDKCYALRGGYIRDFHFNPEGYRLDADTLRHQDYPLQWSLYVAKEALQDSGYWHHEHLNRCGAIVGNLSFPTRHSRQLMAGIYADMARQAIENLTGAAIQVPASNTKYPADIRNSLLSYAPSALIAQAAGLKGPHYSLDAACASSLYAIKLACDALHTAKADMMLAGAVSAADPLFIHMGFSYFHAYACQGERSSPLDCHSGGLTSSEGAGMVVLKRLSDARKDGDKIYAVIEGMGLSNDGKGKFLLAPNPKGQRLAFERAYAQCDFGPEAIDYLECHATGTPVGDKMELNSIRDFFVRQDQQPPLIGSVKSNMGHLLTAAGMAGVFKVILAMQQEYLPATIKVESPLASNDGTIGVEQLVRENQPWHGKGDTLRAGINAFGFGGTNAHMILSAYKEAKAHHAIPVTPSKQSLAIVGMDLHFGDCENLEAFYLSLFLGRQHFRELPARRWKGMDTLPYVTEASGLPNIKALRGAWLEEFHLDLMRFKIQPKEAERLTPQHTLMLKVADGALRDAGMHDLEGKAANIAVITAMETELEIHHRIGRWDMSWQVNQAIREAGLDLETAREAALTHLLKNAIFPANEDHSPSEHTGFIGNIISSRIASLMDFTGPAFTVSSHEHAVYKALEIARHLLAVKEVDAVVLGAIDLAGSLESVLARHALHPINHGKISMGWNLATNGWMIGEGSGAIVLKRSEDTATDRVYAQIDDITIVQSEHTSLRGKAGAKAVEAAAKKMFSRQQLAPADIGLLEVSASGISEEDQAEIEGLTNAYRIRNAEPTCALGNSKAHIGHTFSASGMAAIIKTALSLYYRFLPGVPAWERPAYEESFRDTPFYIPEYSRPWIPEKGQHTLRAAINGLSSDGTSAHILLSEGDHPGADQASPYLLHGGERLFPIKATSVEQLQDILNALETSLQSNDFTTISNRLCADFETLGKVSGEILVLVAASDKELLREIQFFCTQLRKTQFTGKPLHTPAGSYFTPRPLACKGKIALVYPGSGSAYSGLGAALFQAFPPLYDFVKEQGYHPSTAFSNDLHPRSLFALDTTTKQAQERILQTNALSMVILGCTFSAMFTKVLQDDLKVKGDAVFGYSMGETSAMWYSQGIWDSKYVDEKFLQPPLFREKVGGNMKLLAETWNIPESEVTRYWTARLIHLPGGIPGYASLADWFYKKIAPAETRVFLTFINTDTEIVISGDHHAVERILHQHQLQAANVTINNVVHHDFCRKLTDELMDMHRLPITQTPDKAYFSSVTMAPLNLDSDTLALHATEVCCQTVDWPRIVRKMAADHKIFIEVGANANCSRWMDEILEDQEHVAIPMDRKGASTLRNLSSMVARLLAHGVNVNLQHFYEPIRKGEGQRKVLYKTLGTGGPRFDELVLAEENKPHFSLKAENGLALRNDQHAEHLNGKTIIWDEQALLTFASGKISDVFGEAYAVIDSYRRRVRLPMPPYLLVSRVTELYAKLHEYKPSRITTEYDIPYKAYFSTDGQIPWAVAVESGQCDLLLISYLGIDFQNKGEYVYRLLDCTLTFTDDLPFEGQTLRYDIGIHHFVHHGNNLLFFFSYHCYVEDRLVLKMEDGCAGFFSDEELALGQGVVFNSREVAERQSRQPQDFIPLLACEKTAFSCEDLLALTRGDMVSCFGEIYHPMDRNPSLRLPPEDILMLDRITCVDRHGGSSGLGCLEAEKDLLPGDWYFPCHFRDDEVLAGSLQAEGGGQLLRFFMLFLGMQRLTKDARFQPILGLPQKVRCRKEIPARAGKLLYRMDIKETGLTPEPYVVADLEIHHDGYVAVFFENLGLRLQEKGNPSYLKDTANRQEGIYVKPVDKPVLFNEYHITQFALGQIHKCFGEKHKILDGHRVSRQPNTDLQLISRVLEIKNEGHSPSKQPQILTEYDVPANAWYHTQNATPIMPYSLLMEVALQPCGFLGAYLGSTLAIPNKDLFFRNLDGEGNLLQEVDLRDKTVTNHARLLSHTALGSTILQRYTFELSVDGVLFYTGSASFGFFTREDLLSQTGLDQGQHIPSWKETHHSQQNNALSFKLDSLYGSMKLYRSANPASPQLHLANGQLALLDTATIIRDGGKYGKGYIFASKFVKPYEWFFACHFYQDPVMPGSLGVEAMMQAVQLFALQQDLGHGLQNASFHHHTPHRTVWKYRGQILQHDQEMHLEVHIKVIERENKHITMVADASLWKGKLRIYEVTDLAVVIA